jgi:hypothetical protein
MCVCMHLYIIYIYSYIYIHIIHIIHTGFMEESMLLARVHESGWCVWEYVCMYASVYMYIYIYIHIIHIIQSMSQDGVYGSMCVCT